MLVKNQIKKSYERVAVKLKHPTLLTMKGLEGIIGFTTPLASVLTVGADPKYSAFEKIFYGPYETSKVIVDTVASYAGNVGIRDFVNGKMGELFYIIGSTAQNVTEKPLETLATVAGTYILGKVAKYAIKAVRESKEEKYLNKN